MATGTSMSDEEVDESPLDDENQVDLDDEEELGLDDDAAVDTLETDDDTAAGSENSDDEHGADDDTATVARKPAARKPRPDDDEAIDLDEELHPDDVEEPLDVVLRERTASPDEKEDEDQLGPVGGRRITPRSEDEFLCQSCFLVLPRNQLADEAAQLCRDCV